MTKGLKRTTKSILAWVLAVAMTFANVEPVSAAVVVENLEDAVVDTSVNGVSATEGVTLTVSEGDVSEGNVSESDVSTGDTIVVDVTVGNVSAGEVSDGNVSVGDVVESYSAQADVSSGTVSENDVTDGNIVYSGQVQGISWQLDGAGVLTISGQDTSEKAYADTMPWLEYRESITKAVVTAKDVKDTFRWFFGCVNVTEIDFSNFDTSKVTLMSEMFYDCKSLTALDVSGFDTANVTNMSAMFAGCSSLTTLDVSNFKTSNVTNMCNMFCNCTNLESLNIKGFDTSKVTAMSYMFSGCINLSSLNVKHFDTSNVTYMLAMFMNCRSLESLDVSKFKTSKVTNMSMMFKQCRDLKSLNVKGFDTSNVTDMKEMFYDCCSLKKLDVSGFETSKVLNMSGMFCYCEGVTALNVTGFDTCNVTDMSGMFYACKSLLSLDVTNFRASKATNMSHMFYDCDSLTELDLSNLAPVRIQDTEKMENIISSCDSMKRIKVFAWLPLNLYVPLPQVMYSVNGATYTIRTAFPRGLSSGIWFYYDIPNEEGNLRVANIIYPQTYTGKAIKPQVEVYCGTKLLTEKVDYTITYKNNVKVNDATVAKTAPTIIVKGKGNYTKQDSVTFEIVARDLADVEVKATDIAKLANGKVQKPVPTITLNGKKLVKNKDFTVSYPDLEDKSITDAYKAPGTYQILVTGKGNFTGERVVNFTITEGILMSKVKIAPIASYEYTGEEICPKVTVTYGKETLVEETDYTLSYENNIQVGKATVTVTGTGERFAGTKTASFQITGKAIAKATVSGITDVTYNGLTQKPEFSITIEGQEKPLVEDQDYAVTYKNNKNVGKATVTITGMGLYTGTIKKTFRILPADINDCKATGNGYPWVNYGYSVSTETGDYPAVMYMKGGTKFVPNRIIYERGDNYSDLKLVSGKDYTISYKNNIKKITSPEETKKPIAIIKGKGNFTGTMEIEYMVVAADFSSSFCTVTMSVPDMVYSAQPGKYMAKPVLTDYTGKKLTAGVDYDSKNMQYFLEDGTPLTKDSVVEAGQTVKVVVQGIGNYSGSKEGTYRVTTASVNKANVKIAAQVFAEWGNTLEAEDFTSVKVGKDSLTFGEDYEIVADSYKNNQKKGTASVTIRGIENYGGEKTVTFKIVAKEMIWFWKIFD